MCSLSALNGGWPLSNLLIIANKVSSIGILNIDIKFALMLIPVEIVIAFLSDLVLGPKAHKLALKKVNPKENKPVLVETAIVCATVCLMCPWMSFLATILCGGIIPGLILNEASFSISTYLLTFIPNFLETFVLNFPFALCTQLFFIQPLVRKIFSTIYKSKNY